MSGQMSICHVVTCHGPMSSTSEGGDEVFHGSSPHTSGCMVRSEGKAVMVTPCVFLLHGKESCGGHSHLLCQDVANLCFMKACTSGPIIFIRSNVGH